MLIIFIDLYTVFMTLTYFQCQCRWKYQSQTVIFSGFCDPVQFNYMHGQDHTQNSFYDLSISCVSGLSENLHFDIFSDQFAVGVRALTLYVIIMPTELWKLELISMTLTSFWGKKKNLKQSWLPAFWKKIQNTQEIKRALFNWMEQDKTCKFSRKSSFSS